MKTVYGSENCFKCKQLVESLIKDKIQYEYVDINTLTPDELNNIATESGTRVLPIVLDR